MHNILIRQALKQNREGEITQTQIDSLKRTCFLNYRETRYGAKGMRLSSKGYDFLKMAFKSYEIELPENFILTGRCILAIEKSTSFPYYLYKGNDKNYTKLFVFEETYAILLKLCNGDVLQVKDMSET